LVFAGEGEVGVEGVSWWGWGGRGRILVLGLYAYATKGARWAEEITGNNPHSPPSADHEAKG